MDKTVTDSVQLALIELAYAELELMHFGLFLPELRRALEHIASAKKHIRQSTNGSDWGDASEAATDGGDLAANGFEFEP